MNVNMWEHAATQENIAALRVRGVRVVDPDEGYLACGMTGAGRLAGLESIVGVVREVLGLRNDLSGETILITAGPTCEDIDPVRYLTNRSSGKMGYALADAANRRGARVILISGPTDLAAPSGAEWIPVRTTEEMHRAVREHSTESSAAILAAAVSDYRPVAQHAEKIKRGRENLMVELEPTADIFADLAREKSSRIDRGLCRGNGTCCRKRPLQAPAQGRGHDRGQ